MLLFCPFSMSIWFAEVLRPNETWDYNLYKSPREQMTSDYISGKFS